MNDLKKQPGFVVAILAMIGLFSLPHLVGTQDGATATRSLEKSVTVPRVVPYHDDEEKNQDLRDLKPLLDYLADGDPADSLPEDANQDVIRKYLRKQLPDIGDRETSALQCLLITLPDPVASVASARFDEFLDVVQRAIELQGYILDRSLLPWKTASPGSSAPPDRTTRIRNGLIDLGIQATSTTPPQPKVERPGLMVFKSAFPPPPDGQTLKPPSVLLVFVVPESPILGIDKKAFVRSLDLIDRFFYERLNLEKGPNTEQQGRAVPKQKGNGDPGGERRRVLHIVAPCFSGSQRSLEVVIGGRGCPRGRGGYHFRIISNNAGQINRDRLEGIFAGDPRHKVTFRSMVHRSTTVVEATLEYLKQRLGYDSEQVAILIESNTGLAQALAEQVWKKDLANEFIFPLQVSEVRKAYEKEGLLRGAKFDGRAAPERLGIPPDESGTTDDLPRSFTPASSAAIDEMALTQVLTTISHRRYLAVGIVATNPFDLVFLARRVSRFCPNVRLFAIQADLLFVRPENAGDLRGMLVGSTYSLYPANQWIITSYGATPRVPFSGPGAQGLYNAVVAHLWEMVVIKESQGPPLLEFALPYDVESKGPSSVTAAADTNAPPIRQPPVWMSAVGERGIFPVAYDPINEYDLRLMNAVRDVNSIPTAGKSLIIVARGDHVFHFRIFDPDGNMVVDTYAKRLTEQAKPIKDLEKQLESLWPPHELTWKEKRDILSAVTSIVGYPHPVASDRDYLYVPGEFFDAPRSMDPPAEDKAAEKLASRAMRPNPHLLYWLLCLFLFMVCFGVAGLTWVYVRWLTDDEKMRLNARIGFRRFGLGFGHLMRSLNYEVAQEGFWETPFDPQSRFSDPTKNPYPPQLGAGIYLCLINLLVLGLACYVFFPLLVAMSPYLAAARPWMWVVFGITFASLAVMSGTLVLSFLEAADKWMRSPHYGKALRESRRTVFFRVVMLSVIASVCLVAYLSAIVRRASGYTSNGSRTYRAASRRSSPCCSWRGRWSPGSSSAWPTAVSTEYPTCRPPCPSTCFPRRRIVGLKRSSRTCASAGTVDRLIIHPWHAVTSINPLLLWSLVLLFVVFLIRFGTRGMPRSFEGWQFDLPFWSLFTWVIVLIVERTLQLLALWREIRVMLRLAVALPMTQAFNRIPQRLKNWFFGEEDFKVREELILRQGMALENRSTSALAGIYAKLFADVSPATWIQRLNALKSALEDRQGTLELTRSVYSFLDPLWDSLPVEDVPRQPRTGGAGKEVGQEWLASWPLMPKDFSDKPPSKVAPHEHVIVRDWARMAEDLVALQIVRWFAPALSQLLPIMKFLVLGSLCLLLAVSSYPFDHVLKLRFFEAADDHITARYSLGCDWPRSLLRRFCPEGVSKASASSFNSFCSADWRTAPARP